MHDSHQEPQWGEVTLVLADLQVRSVLSVPVELGGGPIGTLDIYATSPREWDATEVSALQAYAGVVASLRAAAARAELTGVLADSSRSPWTRGC